ncbi:MAG: shikimate kinase [Alkaliphilus sp.]|nr:shikimate kinase [Alkaliphilus sp.]
MRNINKDGQTVSINRNLKKMNTDSNNGAIDHFIPYNIVLIGFMGSGKSSVGKQLSIFLNRNWIDVDTKIEAEAGTTISEIFEEKGEKHFRSMEKQAVREVSNYSNSIISCGGGVVLDMENVIALKNKGKIILLEASADTIYQRVKEDENLPILKGNKTILYIRKLMKERESLYKTAADMIINTTDKSIEDICDELIFELMKEKEIAKS